MEKTIWLDMTWENWNKRCQNIKITDILIKQFFENRCFIYMWIFASLFFFEPIHLYILLHYIYNFVLFEAKFYSRFHLSTHILINFCCFPYERAIHCHSHCIQCLTVKTEHSFSVDMSLSVFVVVSHYCLWISQHRQTQYNNLVCVKIYWNWGFYIKSIARNYFWRILFRMNSKFWACFECGTHIYGSPLQIDDFSTIHVWSQFISTTAQKLMWIC